MFNVLFVDDEPLLLEAYRRMLRLSPFQCHTLVDSTQVIEFLAQQPIDIVVADQLMPALTGGELLQQLVKKYPAIKRVLISGNLNLVEPAARVAAHTLLEKPCSKAVLLSTLEALMEPA